MYLSNCQVSLYDSSTSLDAYGDEVASTSLAASGISAYVWEVERTVFNEQSGKMTQIRSPKAFLPNGTTVNKGYRLFDNTHSKWYVVSYVYRDSNPLMAMPIRVELETTE